MEDVVIFGNTDFSELIGYYCEKYKMYKVCGYTVSDKFVKSSDEIPFEQLNSKFPKDEIAILMTVGYSDMGENRRRFCEELISKGYRIADFISPKAIVHGKIGIGNIILDQAIIHPFAQIDNFNYIIDHALVGHHDVIGNYCYLAPSASLSGHVRVDDHCFIGNNATVRNGVSIGHHSMIGAASYVSHDVKPHHMIIPAKCESYDIGEGYSYK